MAEREKTKRPSKNTDVRLAYQPTYNWTFMTLIGFGPNMPQAPFVAVPRGGKKNQRKLDSTGLLDTQFKPRER